MRHRRTLTLVCLAVALLLVAVAFVRYSPAGRAAAARRAVWSHVERGDPQPQRCLSMETAPAGNTVYVRCHYVVPDLRGNPVEHDKVFAVVSGEVVMWWDNAHSDQWKAHHPDLASR